MDNSLTPEKQNAMIEDALHTYPIALMPRDLTTDVLARIQTIPTSRPFRLTWNDLVLATVLSISIGAMLFSVENLPPLFVVQIRKESILLYQYLLVNMRWLLPALSFGLATFLSGLTISFLTRARLR